nr:DNA topoisomerase I [Chloroflexota bacterium]
MASKSKPNSETTWLTQLIHNGVLVPPAPEPRGLVLMVRGEPIQLTPKQEEMALAWARKQGTPYVEDSVFVRNFLQDFSAALGMEPPLSLDEVDFGPAIQLVEAEREAKARLSKEERKAQAAARKAQREALKEQYGYAIVNGERTELGTYMVEPSGIFMGRGKHPLRGRWKEGPQQRDITLNLSPDAPRPPGEWQDIIWQPDGLWVARWKDKLSDKMKYIWLGDTASIRQAREAEKFDQAILLHAQLEQVRAGIQAALSSPDPKRRMIATACYLIDVLGLRVGDEKDPDEADTVGATTLRPEHVTLHADGIAEFHFLGKDSVRWHKKVTLPEAVYCNLQELIQNARPPSNNARKNGKRHPTRDKPQIFPDIDSQDVNAFLSELLPGLTAKVFRTHHATQLVQENLAKADIQASDPEYEKWQAISMANVQAAIFCNHTKKVAANWTARREKFAARERKAQQRVEGCRAKVQQYQEARSALLRESRTKLAACSTPKQREKIQISYQKKLERAEYKLAIAQERLQKAAHALGKVRAESRVAREKRDWNLTTSLKSYIDPRVLYHWGRHVEYDVLHKYYPKNLQRKFSWVQHADETAQEDQPLQKMDEEQHSTPDGIRRA